MIRNKFDQVLQIKNLVIISIIFGIIKFVEQLLKSEYFHDFEVYVNTINVLQNFGNPYLENWTLPYLYPPIVSEFLRIINVEIFKVVYIILFILLIFFCLFFVNKVFRISIFISLGVSGILIKSFMTGNISNIFYLLLIITLFIYLTKKQTMPYYFSTILMSVFKFNFIIFIFLPILTSKNFKKEFKNISLCIFFILAIYLYQYNLMTNEFTDFIQSLKGRNLIDHGWSIFSLLNYNLNINFLTSAFVHMTFFISILFLIYLNKNKLEDELYILLIIIVFVFLNPRLKLYDVAFGLIFLNIAITYLKQSLVLKFYVFSIFVIFFIKSLFKLINFNYYQAELLVWMVVLYFSYLIIKDKKLLNLTKKN